MSRFRRPFHDNLADAVFDVIAASAGSNDPEVVRARAEQAERREAAKAERRRLRAAEGRHKMLGLGAGLLAGGVASLALPPVAAVGVGFLAAAGGYYTVKLARNVASSLAGGGSLRRLGPPPQVTADDLPRSRKDLIQRVVDETTGHLRTLQNVARRLASEDPDGASVCERLVTAGERLCAGIAEEPSKFETAQRALTYYVPKAAYVAETFLSPSDGPRDKGRSQEARQVLGRMEMLLEKTLMDMRGIDEAEMNLEMRLINQALDEELGVRRER
jgi:hypothetical protein